MYKRQAEGGEPAAEGLEGAYSAQELEEIQSVLRKLVVIRDIVMRVNAEYIASAAQADEFRTEPPFRLQGSYRNMNRLAEKVVALMNDDEVRDLVLNHYRGESQTLTTGAEANLLKFREMVGALSAEDTARWTGIKKTFQRNQFSRGADTGDPVGRVVAQLAAFQGGLESIQSTLASQLSRAAAPLTLEVPALAPALESLRVTMAEHLARGGAAIPAGPVSSGPGVTESIERMGTQIGEGLRLLGESLRRTAVPASEGPAVTVRMDSLSHELEMIHSTLATLKDLAAQQRDHLRTAQELLMTRARQGTVELEVTQEMLTNERTFLERVHEVLDKVQNPNPNLKP